LDRTSSHLSAEESSNGIAIGSSSHQVGNTIAIQVGDDRRRDKACLSRRGGTWKRSITGTEKDRDSSVLADSFSNGKV